MSIPTHLAERVMSVFDEPKIDCHLHLLIVGPFEQDDPLLDVHVWLYVERESQKAIVIGKGGSRLREVGTRARREIEALLGARVHLDLRVKVAKDWQRDPKQLQRLGF